MSSNHKYVLVTGANSGLGLGICLRLIDDFLTTHPTSESLTIIYTTRSQAKSQETLHKLRTHLSKHSSRSNASGRVHFHPESVDLTNLRTVRTLVQRLLASDVPYLNAILLNAGIGGWTAMDWPTCLKLVAIDTAQATTWPTYKQGAVGLVTKPQLPPKKDKKGDSAAEPPLGEVFCANTFGHYILTHGLMPLLWACKPEDPAKVLFLSSIEPLTKHYHPGDLQGLRTADSYENTKRLTDLLVLSAQSQRVARSSIQQFLEPASRPNQSTRPKNQPPSLQAVHPGICTTSIFTLYWIVSQAYVLGVLLARWLGSPWATASPYTAALAPVWTALASMEELEAKQAEYGGATTKWGTAVDRLGRATVRPTDVPGWGMHGTGIPFRDTWWGGGYGRIRGATDATKEDVEDFLAQGADAWKQMEELRLEWEDRLDRYDRS